MRSTLTHLHYYLNKGIYRGGSNGYYLSDGRRELNSTQFSAMAPAGYSVTCSTDCPCVYLDSNFQTRNSNCSGPRNYLCEFKGSFLEFFNLT
jgi:hypothetical protein